MDLLGQTPPTVAFEGQRLRVSLTPGAAYCLASTSTPRGLHGEDYRCARAQAAWALAALNQALPGHDVAGSDWRRLAEAVSRAPAEFLGRVSELDGQPLAALTANNSQPLAGYPRVVTWTLLDRNRVTPVPPGHWLLLQDTVPFRATLTSDGARGTENVESIRVRDGHVASFEPRTSAGDADLTLERYAESDQRLEAAIRFLGPEPAVGRAPCASDLVLLTNGRGGMARLCVDIGRVLSKYDCVLGANLHPTLPVDRHVLIKRIRVWVSADGFISPLDFANLARVEAGPPAVWDFVANAGDGRTVEIELTASMVSGRNTTVFQFRRPSATQATGKQLPEQADVRLTVRLDLEDRNFHWETKRNGGAEHHFSTNLHPLPAGSQAGFAFTPAADRQLRIFVDSGEYHPSPEWSQDIPHPVEQSRGQTGSGDGFSPGWFELPLPKGKTVTLVATADPANPAPDELQAALRAAPAVDAFGARLRNAARAFVVQRDNGKTVVAGYPWFLDWGRDSFICARGLLAAGMAEDVKQLALTFARFEKNGTLPNTIFGEDASNRDTSDAPLWFGVVCEELEDITGPVTALRTVLQSIARHYAGGTPNGIRMDPATALVWSPSHFTWMDTNYPAATPREGYPVEIQALWIRLLRQVARFGEGTERKRAEDLAAQALASLERLFWREAEGYYADVLLARAGQTAAEATADDALRSNCLFPISLGLVTGPRAQRCVEAVRRYLVVPGALRSLAPLPTGVPHPVCGNDGRLLNAPKAPYWGRYEGDEDTRRKPAYHNGTAWTWTFPVFCEALARAWDFAPPARAAARHYLGSMDRLLAEGCLDQLPEIVDGDAPHTQRGCDAQAWGVTEALRVWQLLQG